MKRFLLGLGLLAVMTLPVRAHFVWMLPGGTPDKPVVQLVFSDQLAPDDPKYLDKIKQTEVFVLQEKAKPSPLKTQLGKEALEAVLDGKGLQVIGARCEYGVTSRADVSFLLNYYAKTIILPEGKSPKDAMASLSTLNAESLALDIVPTNEGVKVLWQGKPLADAEVTLIGDGTGEAVTKKTDKDGLVMLSGEDTRTAGVKDLIGLRAKHVEAKEGSVGDKKYKEVRHYATLTLRKTK